MTDNPTDLEIECGDGDDGSPGQPVCPRCLAPIASTQHYCDQCGNCVGQYTPNLPFVNIGFMFSPVKTVCHNLCFGRKSLPGRLGHLLTLTVYTMLMPLALLGLPFVWLEKRRGQAKRPAAEID